MSAAARLQQAVVAQLAHRAALDPLAVFDMPPTRAALPHAVVEDPVLASWDATLVTGREGRLSVVMHDGGERPVRLRRLQGRVEDLIATMPADLGEGWRLVRLRLVRSRVVRGQVEQRRGEQHRGEQRWSAVSDFEVRVYRADG